MHRHLVCFILFTLASLTTRAAASDPATPDGLTEETVRVAYVVPSNRAPQANAVPNLRFSIRLIHDWYRDQMHRNGFGAKSFRYETEADGVTPTIHVVSVSDTDAYLRGDIWTRTIQAATNAGIPVWATGEIWILVPEIHLEAADGSIAGGVALGAGFGSGSGAGVAMLGSERLSLMGPGSLENNTTYAGHVVPEIGPYPLVQDVSFAWFEGTTTSSIVSSSIGALAHELGHGFGLPHDFRNDTNFHGNLMANGLRGMRGAVDPLIYVNDDCRLAYAQALALSTNRWFHPAAPVSTQPVGGGSLAAENSEIVEVRERMPLLANRATLACFEKSTASLLPEHFTPSADDIPPQVVVSTSGSVTPSGGQLAIAYTATDNSQLAAAMLQRNGERIGERVLTGTSIATNFTTPYYDTGVADSYTVTVYDREGNRTETSVTITPVAGSNRGPRPFFLLHQSLARTGQSVLLDAGLASDPEGGSLFYEWDFDGDGTYDTAPSATSGLTRSFATPGTLPVRLRVTDSASAKSVSTSIPLRVLPAAGPGTVVTLAVKKATTPGNLTLTWSASCRAEAQDYGIYEGTLGVYYSHTAKDCGDAGHDLHEDVTPPATSAYYLVVPLGGNVEGSYGPRSNATQRPVGIEVCTEPQLLDSCP